MVICEQWLCCCKASGPDVCVAGAGILVAGVGPGADSLWFIMTEFPVQLYTMSMHSTSCVRP